MQLFFWQVFLLHWQSPRFGVKKFGFLFKCFDLVHILQTETHDTVLTKMIPETSNNPSPTAEVVVDAGRPH